MMTHMKSIFKINILLAGIAILAGCSEWTTPESIEIEKNLIENTNPELYAEYCDALKEYKASEHKVTYTTFLNSPEAAANGSEKISMIPDSVDFVQIMNLEISESHLEEIAAVREKKGTKFVFRFSYDECLDAYNQYVADEIAKAEAEAAENAESTEGTEGEEGAEGSEGTEIEVDVIPFEDYFSTEFQAVVSAISEYGLDGFTFAFTGKNIDGMTEEQQAAYTAEHDAALAPVKSWLQSNGSKLFFLEGNPQYVLDNDVLGAASFFILQTRDCRSAGELGLYGLNAINSGKLPADAKVLYAVETPSFIEEEYLVGQFVLGEQIPLASEWVAKKASYEKSGLAIWNVQRDYFNTDGNIYPNVRKAIKTMNPNE